MLLYEVPNAPVMRRFVRLPNPIVKTVLIVLISMLAPFALAQVDLGSTLTYDELLELADASPSVAIATLALERAERQAAATGAPLDLVLSGGYDTTDSSVTVREGVDPVEENEGDIAAITATLNVDPGIWGPSADERARAQASLDAARDDLKAARRAARIDAVAAFQDALWAQAERELAAMDVELARATADADRARAAAGAASDLDVAEAELAVARAEQALLTAERDVALAQASLAATLGRDVPPPSGPLPAAPLVPELAGDSTEIMAMRPDVRNATRDVAEADRAAAASIRDVLPVLTLNASYSTGTDESNTTLSGSIDSGRLSPSLTARWDPDSGLPGLGEGGTATDFQVGVALRIALSTALPDALAAVEIGQDQARARQDTILTQARIAIERAHLTALRAAEATRLAERSAELAHEAARIAALRVDAGSGTQAASMRASIDAQRADLDVERRAGDQRIAVFRLLDALAAEPSQLE